MSITEAHRTGLMFTRLGWKVKSWHTDLEGIDLADQCQDDWIVMEERRPITRSDLIQAMERVERQIELNQIEVPHSGFVADMVALELGFKMPSYNHE